MILGKALGGGLIPISAVVSSTDIMSVIRPGEHGSTFGGNPLAAAVGRAVVAMLDAGHLQERASVLGARMAEAFSAIGHLVAATRSRGLWGAIDLPTDGPSGREFAERLLAKRVIAKDTHGHTIRFAPPVTTSEDDLDWALRQIAAVVKDLRVTV